MSSPDERTGFRWPRPLAGMRGLRPADVPREIFAGLTLAALVVPLNIGYAQVAGLPATMGLYAAIVPLVLAALFTSSRHLVAGPGPSVAALVAAALLGFAAPGDPEYVEYALALALLCAVLFLCAWYFKLGFLENFLSGAVLTGFVSGLGVQVFTNQLRVILGVSVDVAAQYDAIRDALRDAVGMAPETEGYFLELAGLIRELPGANVYSVAIGVGAFVVVRVLKRTLPRVPSALAALIVTTAAVAWLGLAEKGVSVLGALPAGLPSLGVPRVAPGEYVLLLPGAMAIVGITLAEGLLVSRSYAQRYDYKADGNQVLFAHGLANAAAGLTGSMVTGNSVSRSAAMDASGARSQVPSLVAAVAVATVLALFTDVLAVLPSAALAGIVASSVLGLVDVGKLRGLYRARRSEFWVALVCLLSVLILGPLRAVVIAFLLSVIDLLRRAGRPDTAVLREAADGDHFTADNDRAETLGGLIVYRFGAPLFFASANLFLDEVERLVSNAPSPVRWFVLDAQVMRDVDSTGAEAVRKIVDVLAGRDITFAISRASPALLEQLEKYGLVERIGAARVYATNRDAVAAFRRERAAGSA